MLEDMPDYPLNFRHIFLVYVKDRIDENPSKHYKDLPSCFRTEPNMQHINVIQYPDINTISKNSWQKPLYM